MAAYLTAVPDDILLAIRLLTTTAPNEAPDLGAWAREAQDLLTTITNLPAIHDSTPDLVAAEEQLATARATIERLTVRLLDAPERPAPEVARARPATVPLPDAFEGDPKEYLDFKTKLNNKFRADAPTFRDHQHRLSVAISLLKKGAADIIRPYLRPDRVDLADVEEFWQVLDRAFDDPDRKGTAERNLRALRQGKKEFAHYFAEFMRLKADVTWNDAACIDSLRTGCAQEIRDVLRVQLNPLPETLQGVADLLNKIDLQNRQWASESAGKTSSTPPQTQRRTLPAAPIVPVSQRTTANPAWTGPAPMDLSANNRAAARNAARAAKRAKAMAEGLCFTCSSPDHARANCPIQAQYDQARALRANATTTTTTSGENSSGSASPQPSEN